MYTRFLRTCLNLTRKFSSKVPAGTQNSLSVSTVYPKNIIVCNTWSCSSRRRNYASRSGTEDRGTEEEDAEVMEAAEATEAAKATEFKESKECDRDAQSELDALIASDPDIDKRFKVLQLEVDVMRQDGKKVPDEMRPRYWIELLNLGTRSSRRRYVTYLWGIERKRETRKLNKEKARIKREEAMKSLNKDDLLARGMNRNTIFLRIYDTTMNQMYNNRLVQAMRFGQKLVLDCSYESYMTTHEINNCAKQLTLLFADNRFSDNPFDIHFCNANLSGPLMKKLYNYIPTMYDDSFPLNVNAKSYLDLFDKQQLVYLTPHCRTEMETFDHDAVYIVGAMVDKVNSEPLSLAKAKKEGLKMAKLPLDKFLPWGTGSGKSLTLNQMLNILLDLQRTGDWKTALNHVPRRKLVSYQEAQQLKRRTYAREKRRWGNRNDKDSDSYLGEKKQWDNKSDRDNNYYPEESKEWSNKSDGNNTSYSREMKQWGNKSDRSNTSYPRETTQWNNKNDRNNTSYFRENKQWGNNADRNSGARKQGFSHDERNKMFKEMWEK